MGEIYQINCVSNGRSYVGSTVNFQQRKRQHLCDLRHGRHFSRHMQRAFAKHGESSFVFSVIEVVADVSDLVVREAHYIAILYPAFNSGHTWPTRLGTTQSDVCKEKVSIANKGRVHTVTARRRISESLIGNKRSNGNQNARKVTPQIRAQIHALLAKKLGKRKIGGFVGLSKKTVMNVANGVH